MLGEYLYIMHASGNSQSQRGSGEAEWPSAHFLHVSTWYAWTCMVSLLQVMMRKQTSALFLHATAERSILPHQRCRVQADVLPRNHCDFCASLQFTFSIQSRQSVLRGIRTFITGLKSSALPLYLQHPIQQHLVPERCSRPIFHDCYSCFLKISICSLTALLLVPPVAFLSSTARS
jgi:hypothetical protein